MSESSQPQEMEVHNQESLEELAWTIEAATGHFTLILARCNYVNLRSRLIERLQELCSVEIRLITLAASTKTLYTRLREEVEQGQPDALMVVGLEAIDELEQMLPAVNSVREEFRKNFPFPLVLWVTDDVLKRLVRLAPDLESWATTTEFTLAPHTLLQVLREASDRLFFCLLHPEDGQFYDALNHAVDLGFLRSVEVESALRDLQIYGQAIEPDLQAGIDFGRGLDASDPTIALQYFQRSLTYWQAAQQSLQPASNLQLNTSDLKASSAAHHDIQALKLREALVLLNIGIARFKLAEQAPEPDWQAVRQPLQRCIEVFEQEHAALLVSQCITWVLRVLQKLKLWDELEATAQVAVRVHQQYGKQTRLAQDCGFLARAALERQQWTAARQAAQQGLEILAHIPKDRRWLEQRLLMFLAQADRALGEVEAAIGHLIQARNFGDQGYPKAHIRALEELQNLYFQQKQYLEAFQTKRERLSIEQQYGIRAFVGAGRLQSKREEINVDVAEKFTPIALPEMVSPEIAAAGRQQDLDRLLERIGRNDYRLVVIHGNSGVGKSSLVNAGLVPALKRKSIGTRDNLSLVMQVYTNWAEELQQQLNETLRERSRQSDQSSLNHQTLPSQLDRSTSELGTSPSGLETSASRLDRSTSELGTSPSGLEVSTSKLDRSTSELETSASGLEVSTSKLDRSTPELQTQRLLQQFRQLDEQNVRSILIFDQFEEFFFVYPKPEARRSFFQFLAECLQILSLNLVLLLREDYLHLLLEFDRLPAMADTGIDVLSKTVRYELGNFSLADAKAIIQSLTERAHFYLEPALIDRLVQDLSAELGTVRPIELQIVGAQLQAENITKLAQYQALGDKPKIELVEHYLADVVQDCGPENQQTAELVLYLLTDDKGTRPLKTRIELERDLQGWTIDAVQAENQLDLVLKIFVDSGLVFLLPEVPEDRYQLVHDYLAAFIRQQQEPKLNELLAELEKEKRLRSLKEEELRQTLQQLEQSLIYEKALRKRAEIAEIDALSLSSQALLFSHDQLGALVAAVKASKQLKGIDVPAQVQTETLGKLRQAVYQVREINRFEGHSDWVSSVCFSPDGQMLASGSRDHTIKLWNLAGQELTGLIGHSDWVNSVCFSPDGQMLASGSGDDTIKLWSIEGQELKTFLGHHRGVKSVSFSPDGQRLVSGSSDCTIKLWNLDGQVLQTLVGHQAEVRSVCFHPHGQQLASGGSDGSIKLWSLEKGELWSREGHFSEVLCISCSPDGQMLASGGADNTVKLWDLRGQALKTFSAHKDRIVSVCFSPDGQMVASGSGDGSIILWSLDGRILQTFAGHREWVNSISFSLDGQRLASGSGDRTVRLWSLAGRELRIAPDHTNRVSSISFRCDNQILAFGSEDGALKLWHIERQELQTMVGKSAGEALGIESICFSPNGRILACGDRMGTIQLWNLETGKFQTLAGHKRRIRSLCFSPDGQILASRDLSTIKLWSLEGEALKNISLHDLPGRTLCFSPDGHLLAAGGGEGVVKLVDLEGHTVRILSDHSQRLGSIAFSPDGKMLAVGSGDRGSIRFWSLDGQEQMAVAGHSVGVTSISFSPNGQMFASGGGDRAVKVWSIKGELLQTFSGHDAGVTSVSFSPDGQSLASASCDGTVILRNLDLLYLDLDKLLELSCDWLRNYLQTNHALGESDRALCDKIRD